MRQVIYGGASSLDNYIARPNHAVDWLKWSDEVSEVMEEFWPRIDTVIMGRKTYEIAAANGQGEGIRGLRPMCSRARSPRRRDRTSPWFAMTLPSSSGG